MEIFSAVGRQAEIAGDPGSGLGFSLRSRTLSWRSQRSPAGLWRATSAVND